MSKFISCSGSRTRPTFKGQYNKKGIFEVVVNGYEDVYQPIQALAPSCDLDVIVDRYLKTGDSSLLNSSKGFFADITEAPTTFSQMWNMCRDAESAFNALPPEVKDKFDSVVDYVMQLGNVVKVDNPTVEPEIKDKDVIVEGSPSIDLVKGSDE